ncbi:hypothetical protein SUGI_0205900 [Cryptomeria japonica]|nr:hypothetical protein SUGI_0205900 [Cryptomeria japonica]
MAAALQKLFFCIFFALFWRAKALERSDFPSNFIFGTASAAYQYEGAWNEDGKGPSVWDDFSHSPGRIVDGSNGDVADDQYYRYAEDMELVDSLGLKAYRFSISWSRIFPDGRGKINMAGIEYYNNLINALLKKGIEPFVTLFHFDLPKALEDSYGGWLSPHIVKDFEAYADVCFEAFGDRVRYWATLNEPNLFVPLGYTIGRFPPARCSFPFGTCLHGNSLSEPYLAGHHILLSHAAAVNIYNNKYQKTQRESIVFVVSSSWYEALEDTPDDQAAVDRMLAFNIRWFLDPIVFGDYPEIPRFHGLFDWREKWNSHRRTDSNGGIICGASGYSEFCPVSDRNLQQASNYHHRERMAESKNASSNLPEALEDARRINFHSDYLKCLAKAIRIGSDVRGYFIWSLLDNFEWTHGFTIQFGLYHVDSLCQHRYPKLSAHWIKQFLHKNTSDTENTTIYPQLDNAATRRII